MMFYTTKYTNYAKGMIDDVMKAAMIAGCACDGKPNGSTPHRREAGSKKV